MSPRAPSELEAFFRARSSGASYREALETLLRELPLERAQRAMLLLREGRAAWMPMLPLERGRALFVGNALSGTLTALARAGFELTALDASLERLRFARERAACGAVRLHVVLARSDRALPFASKRFELVVREPAPDAPVPREPELRRVARDVLVLVADNRLGYKRSLGRHGEFRVHSPLAFARRALRPAAGERTLRGHRRALATTGWPRVRAFALYPHSQDYSHVVALDAELPSLKIGPKERRNPWKLAARALGLFPWLAPSFALVASERARATRLERLLETLAERIGAPALVAEHLVATRGHSALVFTRSADPSDRSGDFCVHVPLAHHRRALAARHSEALHYLRARCPELPVPAPRFAGELEGLWIACEERLPGLGAPQISGRPRLVGAMLRDAARELALLAEPEPVRFDDERFDRLVSAKLELVARHCGSAEVRARLERMVAGTRARLVGREVPLAICHGDLRSKHVQVRSDGRVVGYLDWGTWLAEDLPYYDLLHLVANERRQEAGLDAAGGWALVRDPSRLRASERGALDEYARRIGLSDEVREAIAMLYPLLVAATAERTWDYSRPRWLERQFRV